MNFEGTRTRLYLPYGSNLHPLRLIDRVPRARHVGGTRLPGYRLRFDKRSSDGSSKCNLVYTGVAADEAFGVLYEILLPDQHLLDAAEGRGKGYEEKLLQVEFGSTTTDAFTYLAARSHVDRSLQPYDWYKALVVSGARYHRFPNWYVDAISAVPAVTDPDTKERCATEIF